MIKIILKAWFFLLVALVALAMSEDKKPAAPQPAQPKAQAPSEEVNFSYGTVVRVAAGQITVGEYDYENDEELNVTYLLDPNVKLKNVDSLKYITPGKTVEVNFVVRNNKKVAVVLALEEEFNDGVDSTMDNFDEDAPQTEEE